MGLNKSRIALETLLAHPLARPLSLDDPATVEARRRIIEENGFLREIYADWHAGISAALPRGSDPVLELGGSTGFMRCHIGGLITSDLLPCRGIDVTLDARRLPFGNSRLRGIVMTNVLHHVPDVTMFFVRPRAACGPAV